jgi:hypothetical protein
MKKEYSLKELFVRKVDLILIAGDRLGYNFRKHNPNKKELQRQAKESVALADKWSEEEMWVCVKPCKHLKYGVVKR